MLQGYGPVTQALLGTLFTWGLTAAGAGLVVFIRGKQRKLLDSALGFAAGVMTAASYWSLLAPAIEMAQDSGLYGEDGRYAFAPVTAGFLLGAAFVYGTDLFIEYLGINSPNMMIALTEKKSRDSSPNSKRNSATYQEMQLRSLDTTIDGFADCLNNQHSHRRRNKTHDIKDEVNVYASNANETSSNSNELKRSQWKRIMLLVVAITVHNIPEGLAVGVGFGAVGSSASATFEKARNLAIGIGIQNFPEGLAVSLPLHSAGFSMWRSFWYGQLSGMVEPVFGVLGAVAVAAARPALPYALAFAAGAMIYVVVDDIIPEANTSGNGKLATWGAVLGFVVMMCLDVGLG
ncbi:zinc transporter ZIP11-like [Ctenocephalides felis]|uniref:zinc transporter ZIP11-like n=1 Tax=Ctenocephalides felis TaxID=7515 RepID=UPI000E6E25CA|nr:zinc transporter ZIP11-like [Ctenocephalides felis]XP_026463714.1 zinc transporter ZIP11-like [Ctenocephalides felis]